MRQSLEIYLREEGKKGIGVLTMAVAVEGPQVAQDLGTAWMDHAEEFFKRKFQSIQHPALEIRLVRRTENGTPVAVHAGTACDSCGEPCCDLCSFCHGCNKHICPDCVEKFHHYGQGGLHGLKKDLAADPGTH